jgi:ferredoxin-NADP reductase
MSVTEVNGLLYLADHPQQKLERALRIPALSTGWQASFQALLESELSGSAVTGNPGLTPELAPPPAWPGFRSLRVSQKGRESESVLSLELMSANGRPLAVASPGQFVILRLRPKDEHPLLRSFSLCGPSSTERYRLGIKKEPFGAASQYLADHVNIGDILDVSAPRGTFILRPGDWPIVLISAGVGVTPVLSMLYALASGPSDLQVWWFYGARNGKEHPFAEEARRLIQKMPHGRSYVQYSQPAPEDQPGSQFDSPGHLSVSSLERVGVSRNSDFYLCGPPPFLRDFTAGLSAWGIAPERVHVEIFGLSKTSNPGIVNAPARSPHLPAGVPGKGPRVSFSRSGLDVNWDPALNSLLELAEACDVPVQWACRSGVCHTCERALINGSVHYDPEPIDPPADGNLLTCCSRPEGDVIIDL